MIINIPKKETYLIPAGTYKGEIVNCFQFSEDGSAIRLKFKIADREKEKETWVAGRNYEFDQSGNSPLFEDLRSAFGEEMLGVAQNGLLDTERLLGQVVGLEIAEVPNPNHPEAFRMVTRLFPSEEVSVRRKRRSK